MASKFPSVLVLLFLCSSVASAQQIYTWKDNKGLLHISNNPPAEVRAEKVRGLNIGPIPPVRPGIADPPTPSGSSDGKEKAVLRVPTKQQSPLLASQSPSRWLLVVPDGKPWESFNSAQECEIYKLELIRGSTASYNPHTGGAWRASPNGYNDSKCVRTDTYRPSKEANVILLFTGAGRDPEFNNSIVEGRVFNRGLSTARNVVVKYKALNARGQSLGQGQINTVPRDLPGLTAAEFRGEIRGGVGVNGLRVEAEVVWSKD